MPKEYHPLIEIKGLHIAFKQDEQIQRAIQDISFNIEKGKITAIVGESGSGKSVTALSIAGLLPSHAVHTLRGEILYHTHERNINLLHQRDEELQSIRGNKIGFIFQEPMTSLNPLMSCGKQVMEVLIRHKKLTRQKALQEVIALFHEVKLPHPTNIVKRYPHELSGGQKQRVLIAMAIACKPDLIIADEPTTALDVTVQKNILQLIHALKEKYKIAVLFISHDLALVKQIADYVIVMYKGRIVEQNTTTQLFAHPAHPYTQQLLACRPPKHIRVKRLLTIDDIKTYSTMDADNIIDEKKYQERLSNINQNPPLLELKNIAVWYPQKKNFIGTPISYFKAVNDVSFTIHQGETYGLVGESGCGKSTIGKAITGLVSIHQGHIHYRQQDTRTLSASQQKEYKRSVQMIFQDPYGSLNPRVSIGYAIKEVMDVYQLHPPRERKTKS
jgi:ATPase components of various ABC-type transport systems, contain duplicated ATPase